MMVDVRVGAGPAPWAPTAASDGPAEAGAMMATMMGAGAPAGRVQINVEGQGWAPLIGLNKAMSAADCADLITRANPAHIESRDSHLDQSVVCYVDPADLDSVDEARELAMAKLSELIARGVIPHDDGSRYWVALGGDRYYPALHREQWSLGDWRLTSTHSEVNPDGVDVNGDDWMEVWAIPGSRLQPVDDDRDDCVDVSICPGVYAEPMVDGIWVRSDEGTGFIRISSPGGLCANIIETWERWLRR